MIGEVTALTHIDRIEILDGRREINPAAVKRLANSIEKIGLRTPVTVRRKGDDYTLVAGRHRIEAFKQLDRDMISITIVDKMTAKDARLWEISENLDRAELTKLERDENIAEWIRITEKVSSQPERKPKGGRPEGGVEAAARDLGVDRSDAHRAVKVDSLSDEAKAAAREHGLDDNRSALLDAARESDPEDQVAKIVELAAEKTKPRPVYSTDEGAADVDHEEGLRVIAARGFLNRAVEAKKICTIGKLRAPDVTEAMIKAADDAAAAWTKAAHNLRGKKEIAAHDTADHDEDGVVSDDEATVAAPAVLEDNLFHAIGGMNENARVFHKLLKVSALDLEAVTRINTAISRMIGKWQSVQSTLKRKGVDLSPRTQRQKNSADNKISRDYHKRFGYVSGVRDDERVRFMVLSLQTGVDQLADVRREDKEAEEQYDREREEFLATPITPKVEHEYTAMIKRRTLYEGACKLAWQMYFKYRDEHPDLPPLSPDDLEYAGMWTSCAVRPSTHQ